MDVNDLRKAFYTLIACALFAIYGEISYAISESDRMERLSGQITLHIPGE
ncbi:hypothetical protein GCM10007094_19120 [Pseudovibrio japonicus]|uniref:Uncharacterized protein n=1 Tax=Pseudovibrio japonicus TaxID=366534 RepID=A0ABQ3E9Y7_9HYPH|nr:hypothetical protein GCM10007094_19120 [Pseudovibrio japonicus]